MCPGFEVWLPRITFSFGEALRIEPGGALCGSVSQGQLYPRASQLSGLTLNFRFSCLSLLFLGLSPW